MLIETLSFGGKELQPSSRRLADSGSSLDVQYYVSRNSAPAVQPSDIIHYTC